MNEHRIELFLQTEQTANIYFGDIQTPMKAAIIISNPGVVIFEGTELKIEVREMKTDRTIAVRQITVGKIPAQETVRLPVDFSDIRVYGTFTVTICGEGIEYETMIARIPPARRRAGKVGVSTHLSTARRETMKIAFGLLSKVGVGWLLDDVLWDQCNPTADGFTIPQTHIDYADLAHEMGFKLRYMLDARTMDRFYGCGRFPYEGKAKEMFLKYVTEVARTFRGKAAAYELISEYDHNAKCLRMLCKDNNIKYARLQKEAYCSIKKEDPDVLVLHGGTVRKNIPFMKDILEAGAGDYTDALVIHPYPMHLFPVSPLYRSVQTWETMVDWYRAFEALADAYCPGKPLMNTESGWSTYKGVNGCTLIQQAAFELQHYIASMVVPSMELVDYYDFSNDGISETDYEANLGLLAIRPKEDTNRFPERYLVKPAFGILSVIANELWAITFERELDLNQCAACLQFKRDDGKYITAVWSLEGSVGRISFAKDAFSENDYAIDLFSNRLHGKKNGDTVEFSVDDCPLILCTDRLIDVLDYSIISEMKDYSANAYSAMELML